MADGGAGPGPGAACAAAPGGLSQAEVEERLARLDRLLGQIEHARADVAGAAREAVTALAEVYGTALLRLAGLARGAAGAEAALRRDELLAHLLALHGESPPRDQPGGGRRGGGRAQEGPRAGRPRPALIPAQSLLRRPAQPGRGAPGGTGGQAAGGQAAGEQAGGGGRCEVCGEPAPSGHRHLLDLQRREALCACRGCAILFDRERAGEGRYRLIPERRMRLPQLSPADLGVPVGLAFFVRRSNGSVAAHYPSPAGATQWEVDPAAWRGAVRRCPRLADLAADVEAVLVNTARGRAESWLVPVDDCYRLVAAVRGNWEGISGGDRVWPQVEQFFAGLRSVG